MPQIADLEIAATWDEIELEAALSAESQGESPAGAPSALVAALRAVEELKQLFHHASPALVEALRIEIDGEKINVDGRFTRDGFPGAG